MKTFNVTDETHRTVKLLCVEKDISISDALDILVEKWTSNADYYGVFKEYEKRQKDNLSVEGL